MIDLRERQQLYNGFGEGLARAFEMAVTPAVFAAVGLGLDAATGLFPWITLGLLIFAVVGIFIRTYYAYVAEMAVHEREATWARRSGTATADTGELAEVAR